MKIKLVFVSLTVLSLASFQARAEIRTSILLCTSKDNNQSTTLKITKKFDGTKRTLTFVADLATIGEFDGQRVEAHAGASFKADPNVVDPLLPYFTVENSEQESLVSIKPLNGFLDPRNELPEIPFPGYLVQAVLPIKNDIGFDKLILRGIIGNYRNGDIKAMNANAAVADGNRVVGVGNYDLSCSYDVSD